MASGSCTTHVSSGWPVLDCCVLEPVPFLVKHTRAGCTGAAAFVSEAQLDNEATAFVLVKVVDARHAGPGQAIADLLPPILLFDFKRFQLHTRDGTSWLLREMPQARV